MNLLLPVENKVNIEATWRRRCRPPAGVTAG